MQRRMTLWPRVTLGLALTVAVLAGAAACAGLRVPRTPVPTLQDMQPGDRPASQRVLLVFLPGAGDLPDDLIRQGFVEQVRRRGITADVIIPDLHVGYYTGRSFEARLKADVIEPARAKGYTRIWLAGISLGGFGSLVYARQNPGVVEGVIALAPFIATNGVLDEVRKAGGIARWNEPVVEGDWQRDLLLWLKGYGDPTQNRPSLFIGYGTEDGFAEFNAAVGALLPPERVRSAPGGHDWAPWQRLWGEFLDLAPLPRTGAGVAATPPPATSLSR